MASSVRLCRLYPARPGCDSEFFVSSQKTFSLVLVRLDRVKFPRVPIGAATATSGDTEKKETRLMVTRDLVSQSDPTDEPFRVISDVTFFFLVPVAAWKLVTAGQALPKNRYPLTQFRGSKNVFSDFRWRVDYPAFFTIIAPRFQLVGRPILTWIPVGSRIVVTVR